MPYYLVALFLSTFLVAQSAEVRVIHASPDTPAVDILVNGTRSTSFAGITFKRSTRYNFLQPGIYTFDVVPTNRSSPVLINSTLALRDVFTPYTIVAIDKMANIKGLVLTDAKEPPTDYQSQVRFVHASPDAPDVDVVIKGGPAIFKSIAFGSSSDYLQVVPGTYILDILVSGTNTVALEVPNVVLVSEASYSILAVGLVSNKSLDAVVYFDI